MQTQIQGKNNERLFAAAQGTRRGQPDAGMTMVQGMRRGQPMLKHALLGEHARVHGWLGGVLVSCWDWHEHMCCLGIGMSKAAMPSLQEGS